MATESRLMCVDFVLFSSEMGGDLRDTGRSDHRELVTNKAKRQSGYTRLPSLPPLAICWIGDWEQSVCGDYNKLGQAPSDYWLKGTRAKRSY
jgi:hypothetical protein